MLDANYFAHSSRDGGSFDNRVRRFARHRALGETLAWLSGCGRRSAGRVVSMWMNSPPHRAVVLSAQYRRVGVGKRTGRPRLGARLRRDRGLRFPPLTGVKGRPGDLRGTVAGHAPRARASPRARWASRWPRSPTC